MTKAEEDLVYYKRRCAELERCREGCKCYGNYPYLVHAEARTEGESSGESRECD